MLGQRDYPKLGPRLSVALLVIALATVGVACGDVFPVSAPPPAEPLPTVAAVPPSPVALPPESPTPLPEPRFALQWAVEPFGAGTVAVKPAAVNFEYRSGSEVEVRAVPDEGFEFKHWVDDLSSTSNPAIVVLDRDRTVRAVFVKLERPFTPLIAATPTPNPTATLIPSLTPTPASTPTATPTPAVRATPIAPATSGRTQTPTARLTPASTPTSAAGLTVASLADDGPGSLRQAIRDADPGDIITFRVRGAIVLTSGELVIDNILTIQGPGATDLVISGNDAGRVFRTAGRVAISGLTITNGRVPSTQTDSDEGGGILNRGRLTLNGVVITKNGARLAGGIRNEGVLNMTKSTVSENRGGLTNLDSAIVVDSTFSDNLGDGIFNSESGQLVVSNSTVSNNTGHGITNRHVLRLVSGTIASNSGAGVKNEGGTVTVVNTIIGNNLSGDCKSDGVTSLGHNIDSDGTCGLSGPGDKSGVDPRLGRLADNGGPTKTHALLPDSPAIDAGDDGSARATDQRGVVRPQGSATDIGAYETPFTARRTPTSTRTPTVRSTPTPAAVGVVDQQQPTRDPTRTLALGGGSEQKLAQVITAGVTGSLKEIRLELGGSTGVLIVEIQAVSDGAPNGVVLAAVNVAPGTLPASCCSEPFESVVFPNPPSMASGSQFAVVLRSTGNHATVSSQEANPYARGGTFFDARPNRPEWIPLSPTGDLAFETVVVPGPTPTVGTWSATGEMSRARRDHTATLLANGKVLVQGWSTKTVELYEPSTGRFSATSDAMVSHGQGSTATLLLDGRVLIVGGTNALQSAEIFDPTTGFFAMTGVLNTVHSYHSATLLPDGKVLIAAGQDDAGPETHAVAELYDPKTGIFSLTGSLNAGRSGHAAPLLSDGRVLIVGGIHTPSPGLVVCSDSAEMYDPATGTFSPTGKMTIARCGLGGSGAPLLLDGKVLVIGGTGTLAELYDPATGTFIATGNTTVERRSSTATLLPSGEVLVAGGFTAGGPETTNTAELYDPLTGTFLKAAAMASPLQQHTATLLQNGRVLVTGGLAGGTELSTSALFTAGP